MPADVIWQPDKRSLESTNISRFHAYVRSTAARNEPYFGDDYASLHRWSVEHPDEFWKSVWDWCGVRGNPGDIACIRGTSMLDWRWFPDASLSFAENLLLSNEQSMSSIAVFLCDERDGIRPISRAQLLDHTIRMARFLQSIGLQSGDRVCAVVPNGLEAIVGMLACAAIGCVWSSCSPEFGDDAISDRFGQITPKLMITTASATYNGKRIELLEKVLRILPRLPSIEAIIVSHGRDIPLRRSTDSLPCYDWETAMEGQNANDWSFPRFAFNHPLCVLYSSGTTGAPKCIVHGTGGTLLQHLKEHQLHADLRPGDHLFYYTTTGWMMWNWLVSGLASGASIVAYDGSPVYPDPSQLWSLTERIGLTHFGAGARYYSMMDKSGYVPCSHHDLSSLRCVMSTGSPLLPESFDWIYRSVSPSVNLASISGGTEILSCFVLGNPTLDVVRGEIQCKGLGMDVKILDSHGRACVGVPGELVCATPFPSMPIGFWNDPESRKYRAAYFEQIPGVWCHGDWAMETERGGFVIFGRSDATLNPGGVRIGTAELYQQLEAYSEIAESLATVLRQGGDEQIVLFVRMADSHSLTTELIHDVQQRIKSRCSARHVPAMIVAAPDLPRTVSGKLSEIAVRSAINGSELGNAGALANPKSLDFFRNWKPIDR